MKGIDLQTRRYLLTLTEPMLGTVPKDPEVYASYIATKAPTPTDDELETVPVDLEAKGWTGFHTDEQGLFVYDYLVKGFFKEAGNILKDQAGIKALRSKLDNLLFVSPRRLRITTEDGTLLTEPDFVVERPLRAMTQQGPRVTLARSDAVDAGRRIPITVTILANKEIDFDLVERLLDYGALKALGQFRNGGYGRITWEAME